MKPNAISFSNVSWFPFRFFKNVENLRPDVTILSVSDLEEPAVFNPVRPERFPDIKFHFFESDSTDFEKFTTTLIKLNIDNKYVHTDFEMLGVCYINLNDFKKAEDLFQKLIESHPDNYWYFYSLGVINMKMRKSEMAKLYLKKSISLKQGFADAQSALKQVNQNFNKSGHPG